MKNAFLISILTIGSVGSAYAINDVKIFSAEEVAHCKFIAEDTCQTKKVDTKKQCNKWHKKNANNKAANAVVITDSAFTESKRPTVNGANKTIRTTTINAKYYSCAANMVSKSKTKAVSSVNTRSIEERLRTLNALNKKGLITEEEYKTKRAEILRDL